ncbi:TonB-dependent receptor domain-containing protein [Psychroserpens sp.]|uniref:TonB-dependent receptor domain-containing protein n=1 Tax=Psychroserpens sp. TaxID=2020870 RepID=UPI00385A2678
MKLKLSLFFIFFTTICFAQTEVIVSGKVVDAEENFPLEYATISFIDKAKNTIVTGGITDIDGVFNIEIAVGSYDVKIEYLSYKTKTYTDKLIDKNIDLGTVGLSLNLEALDAVEIIAERTTAEIKLDKKIYNIGKDLTVRGGTVSDVLDNVPSVSVDVEGNVALRGNDDVRILINGKPSGLVGLNSTEALRQLPAEAIERVEVITSPSARYDAQGTAGILNIILRRSKLQGLNGAVTVNAGYPLQAGISGNLNYRTGDFNFFNTTGYNYREIPGNAFSDSEFISSGNTQEETRNFDRKRKGLNTNFGVEWYITEKASLTTSIQFRDSDNEQESTNNIIRFINDTNTTEFINRFDPEFEDDKTIQYTVNFDKQFGDNTDHRLTTNFQYESSSEREQSLIEQNDIDVEDVTTNEDQKRIFLQSDYVLPIGEVTQLEFGYQGRFLTLDTDYTVFLRDDQTNAFELSTDLTNNLIYREYVNAAYTQFGSKLGDKFSYLLGLRLEDTRITIDQQTSNAFDRKNYLSFFPTVNLAYEISEDENVTLGYNRRIRRPRSRFINPFPSRSSPTSLFQGNPDLDPSFSDTFDLGYYKRFSKKLTLNSSIYYQRTTDSFNLINFDTNDFFNFSTNEIVSADDPGFDQIDENQLVPILRRSPINLATNDRYGFEFTLTYRPTKKWNINGNFNIFQSITDGVFQEQDFSAENLSWFVRLNNKYKLPGEIDWQTRLNYRGPREDAQNKTEGIFSMNLAFSKDLFKERASIAFNVSDVFNSRKRRSETMTPTFNSYSEFQWRERSFNLSFTYRFNQKKKRERSGRGSGDDFDFEG